MWRLKQLMPKDQAGLEGRSIEVGPLKLQVRNLIAEGGFSCVYLARDAQTGVNYALKHIVCNDVESLDLVRREIGVMRILRGHPNVVALHAHAMFDNGRTKDFFLAMEYCEKSLVSFLENRGAGYFEEKQMLLIFRDIVNAVCGMHSQSPPVAHRDLKVENVLMGSNGVWKLCDFGSTSTNHKKYERAEEMGLEEDIIRKHTTPAYRAPEMWDLFRREVISEKVDIWALGCLLFRLAFLKPAFDGESKLQILNGNYKIPDGPKYSDVVIQLINEMLMPSPEARPDIMQIWRRINDTLPSDYRKSSPDRSSAGAGSTHEASGAKATTSVKSVPVAPSRSPPAPPVEAVKNAGSFWASQFAADVVDSKASNAAAAAASSGWSADFTSGSAPRNSNASHVQQQQENNSGDSSSNRTGNISRKGGGVSSFVKRVQGWSKEESSSEGGYSMMSEMKQEQDSQEPRSSSAAAPSSMMPPKAAEVSSDGAFNAFVAEFDNSAMQASEMEKLRLQLKKALAEKAEFAGKYEKLTAICRSQRQEIQELKASLASAKEAALAAGAVPKPPQSRRTTRSPEWNSSGDQVKEKQQNGGSSVESSTPSSLEESPWQAFQASSEGLNTGRRPQQHVRAASVSVSGGGADAWGIKQLDNLKVPLAGSSDSSSSSLRNSSMKSNSRSQQQPAGWAGF